MPIKSTRILKIYLENKWWQIKWLVFTALTLDAIVEEQHLGDTTSKTFCPPVLENTTTTASEILIVDPYATNCWR